MNDHLDESELSRRLHDAADGVSGLPDLADVERRAGTARSRRRIAGGVFAAMLIAGAGGIGFGIGRSVADDQGEIASGDGDVVDRFDDSSGVSEAPVTTVAEPTSEDVAEPAPMPSGDEAFAVPTTIAVAGGGSPADVSATDQTVDGGYYVQPVLDVVYERTLADGMRVRLQRGQSYAATNPGGQWQPAAYCWPSVDGRMTIDGPDVVDVGWMGWYEELYGDVQVERSDLGGADGHPLRILAVQTSGSVTEVAVTWRDGATDRAPIVNGVAALVVDGSGAWEQDFSIEVVTADGVETLADGDIDHWSDPEFVAGCEEPPPGLPEAGEQPADPAGEEAALRARFEMLWDREVQREEKSDLLDDWTGVGAAIDQVDSGPYAESAATAEHRIDELVFTSPTEAWFFYTLLTDVSDFRNRYGRATLVDGAWQFPRGLICQDLGLGGGGCEPWAEGIYPPSYYERYGEPACFDTDDGVICEDAPAPTLPVPPPTTIAVEG